MSKPYLLVDCGNSRSKWALLDSTGLGAVSYVDNSAAPEQIIEKLPSAESLDKVYLAAVSSSQIPNQISSHFNRLPISLLRVKNPYLGLGLAYKSIDQLGVDRWLAMLWAWLNYQQSCLVVNIGTAMTIDAINDAGEHLGGVITPGPRLQFQSLHQHTHAIDLQTVKTFSKQNRWGKNTTDCVQAGVLYALSDSLQQHFHALASQNKQTPKLIISGGDAAAILPHIEIDYVQQPDIVLHGMAAIAERDHA